MRGVGCSARPEVSRRDRGLKTVLRNFKIIPTRSWRWIDMPKAPGQKKTAPERGFLYV